MSTSVVNKIAGLLSPSAEIFNVLDYGADNTGTSDASLAIQAALDTAKNAGGGTVYIPEGTYLIGTDSDNGQTHGGDIKGGLKVGDNVTVRGDGAGTIIKIDPAGAFPSASWSKMNCFCNDDYVNGNTNIVIRDMTLDGSYAERNYQASPPGSANEQETLDFVTVYKSLIKNLTIINSTHDALDLDLVEDVTVENCKILWRPDRQARSNTSIVETPPASGTYRVTLTSHGFEVGEVVPITGTDVGGFNSYHTITAVPSANTYEFETTAGLGDSSTHGETGTNSAYAGVHSSGYRLAVRNCLVEWAGYARNAPVFPTVGGDASGAGIGVGCERSDVQGNVVRNCCRGILIEGAGAGTSGTYSVVDGNRVETVLETGIEVTDACTNVVVSSNTVTGVPAGKDSIRASGSVCTIANNIVFNTTSARGVTYDTTTQGGTIVGNTLSSSYIGIEIDGASGPFNITNNSIRGSLTGAGIWFDNSSAAAGAVSGNTIAARPSATARGAINIESSTGAMSVTGNYITGTAAGRAILCAANDAIISGNTITGNLSGGTDIEVTGTDCVISGNRCTAATTQGILLGSGTLRTNVYGNNLNGCAAGVTNNETPGTTNQVAGATGAAANIP